MRPSRHTQLGCKHLRIQTQPPTLFQLLFNFYKWQQQHDSQEGACILEEDGPRFEFQLSPLLAGGWGPAASIPLALIVLCVKQRYRHLFSELLGGLNRTIQSTDPGSSIQKQHDKCELPIPPLPSCGLMGPSSRKNVVDKLRGTSVPGLTTSNLPLHWTLMSWGESQGLCVTDQKMEAQRIQVFSSSHSYSGVN